MEIEHAITSLESLPQTVVLQVLRHLVPDDLVRLESTCTAARCWAHVDDVWRPHVPQSHSPAHNAPEGAWRTAYCRFRRSLCTECRLPTPHVFVPLGCHLCMSCEQRNPTKYALATELEARQRFGLGDATLETLPSVFAMRRRWFLRSSVAALAGNAKAGGATGDSSSSAEQGSSSSSSTDDGAGSADDDGRHRELPWHHDSHADDSRTGGGRSCGSSGGWDGASSSAANTDGGGTLQIDVADESEQLAKQLQALEVERARREARRVERRAAKHQAKAEQRARRQLKSEELHWPGAKSPGQAQSTSPGASYFQQSAGGSGSRGSQHRHVDRKKERYKEQKHQQQHKGGGHAHGRAARKTSSAWLAEREEIHQEFGTYDASGLELAADDRI